MTSRLNDKTVLILGGTTGIGLATGLGLAALGANVTVTGRSADKVDAVNAAHGEAIRAVVGDGADASSTETLLTELGTLDHLVIALGGGGAVGPFNAIEEATFRKAFDNKFWPYILSMQTALPYLSDRGSITLVTGAAAQKAVVGMSGLSATNGALEAMVAPIAVEIAPKRINAISPGLISTPYWDQMGEEARDTMYENWGTRVPLERVGTAEEVSEMVIAVLTNTYMTGVVTVCDGGLVAT